MDNPVLANAGSLYIYESKTIHLALSTIDLDDEEMQILVLLNGVLRHLCCLGENDTRDSNFKEILKVLELKVTIGSTY